MKKLLLPFLALLFLIACEKESTNNLLPEAEIHDNDSATTRASNKRNVCHNGKIKNISVNAIPAHQGHGDAVDMDEDGYFDIDNPCSLTDCDDTDPAINPGATEIICNEIDDDCNSNTLDSSVEICDNGIDDDCDGDVDENDDDCVTSCVDDELEVTIDPDGEAGNGDEYILYVFPVDNSPGIIWASYSDTGARDDWDGANNTATIVSDQGAGTGYAAGLCANLVTNGCEDWYLPAKLELKEMITQLGPSGNMSGFYWSSTESPLSGTWSNQPDRAWRQFYFNGGSLIDITQDNKALDFRCRCVRR